MHKLLKRMVAVVLMISILGGMIPAEGIAAMHALAEEQEENTLQLQAAQRVVDENAQTFSALADEARLQLSENGCEDDGEWQYVILPEKNYAVITGHHDAGKAQVDIPAVLGGADVVALLSGVFYGHDELLGVTMTGNVYYAPGDALPRGVTVRGYHGSYAQRWAQENRCAFENLSELDFAPGVVDCSDVASAHFIRHSADRVTLRALEATRLQAGSLFFLADTENLYTVSFYQVEQMEPLADGNVILTCSTPDISQVLTSFEATDTPMIPDWETFQLAAGMASYADTLQMQPKSENSSTFGFHFTPEISVGKNGKFSGDVGYDVYSKATVSYGKTKLKSFTVTNREGLTLSGELSVSNSLYDEPENKDETIDAQFKSMLENMRKCKKLASASAAKIDQKLCSVTLFSLYGIVNFALEVNLNVTFKGTVTLTYTSQTVTTYKYVNEELTSTSTKEEESIELKAEAEIKAGVTASIKMYLIVVEAAKLELFIGFKATASYSVGVKASADEDGELSSAILVNGVESGDVSLAVLNMLDCVQLDVDFLVELTARIGNDLFTIFKGEYTVLEIPIAKLHFHTGSHKFVMEGTKVTIRPKSFSDMLHSADDCPMKDAISLMVTEISETEPAGSVTLFGRTEIPEPTLDLPDYGLRVTKWFTDKAHTQEAQWPLPVKSGDKLWGRAERVAVYTVVDYSGKIMKLKDGSDAVFLLGRERTQVLDGSLFENGEHIKGWVEIAALNDPTFLEEPVFGARYAIQGDMERHTVMAICDNDLTVVFKDTAGNTLEEFVWGHHIEIPESLAPRFESEYPADYAVATYEWRTVNGIPYEFPVTVTSQTKEKLVLFCTPTGIKRIFVADDSATVLGSAVSVPSGAAVYSTEQYFEYYERNDDVIITGFKEEQTYTDEDGQPHKWTAVPEVVHIPAYINGKPVTQISSGAFAYLDTLLSVKVPQTVTEINSYAFAQCPNMLQLDLSACANLSALPEHFAEGNTSLASIALPESVTSIGDNAFRGCTSLTKAVINADIGDRAFEDCTSLASVQMKYRVTSIGASAFEDCKALTSLTVPCSVEYVGDHFIYGCTRLTDLHLDGAPAELTNSIIEIGEGSTLASVKLSLGVTSIGSRAFSNGGHGNPCLTTLVLPEALREVGDNALAGTAVERLYVYDLGMIGTGFARSSKTLRELEFEKGVISSYAFAGCENLTRVTMGDQVFAIGDHAFDGCSAMEEITIGKGVESVGDFAFNNCTSLRSVVLGEKLLTLGEGALKNCSALTELVVPPTVEEMGTDFLSGCTSLKKLTIGGTGTPYFDGWQWLGYMQDSALETVIIGEGVEILGAKSLCNTNNRINIDWWNEGHKKLTTVVLPSTLQIIEEQAFSESIALKVLNLPASLKHIGKQAFENCGAMTLNCAQGMNLLSIGEEAFIGCASMTGINLGGALESLGSKAFYNCTALEALVVPPSAQDIGNEIISGCTGLKTLTIGGPNTPYFDGWQWLGYIHEASLETVIIGEGVEILGAKSLCNTNNRINIDWWNEGYQKLTTVVLPSTLETIEEQAFSQNKALGVLALPSGLTRIDRLAFDNCSAMTLECPADLNLESIGEQAFQNCSSMSEINLGSKLESIGSKALFNCTALETLVVPPSAASIGDEFIGGCTGLRELTIGGPNTPYFDGWQWLGYIAGSSLEKVVIAEGVTTLGAKSLCNTNNRINIDWWNEGHQKLSTVVLPSTLDTIEEQALSQSKALGVLELPEGLKCIGRRAFESCEAMSLVCPAGMNLESIGEEAFVCCASLTGINLGRKLKTIGRKAFYDCAALVALVVPPSVADIGDEFIGNCKGLKTLTIGGPNTPYFDGWQWLGHIPGSALESVIIGEGVITLGAKSLANTNNRINIDWWNEGHKKLQKVSLPSTLQTIEAQAFGSAVALTDIVLPDGIAYINETALLDCKAMSALHTNAYSKIAELFAAGQNLNYVCDSSSALLRLMEGELLLAEKVVPFGEELGALLSGNIPADHDGLTFDGWYIDAAFQQPWSGARMPSFELVLYADMAPVHQAKFMVMAGGAILNTCMVSAGEGHVIPWPEEPVAGGYRFEGWYTDPAMTIPLEAGTVMGKQDVTFYGKMSAMHSGTVYTPVPGGMMLSKFVLMEGESTNVWLPGTVQGKPVVAIAADAFDDADAVVRLHLPDSIESIPQGAFADMDNLQWIATSDTAETYRAVNGILYTAEIGTLVFCPRELLDSRLTVPETVHTIAEAACANMTRLQAVDLGDHVSTLEKGAFAGCGLLQSFTAYGLTSIGENAIPYNSGMKVYGPEQEGVLRSYFMMTGTTLPLFQGAYNTYAVHLYVDGVLLNVLALEAGSRLPAELVYGEMDDGLVVHTWYMDKALTQPWGKTNTIPARDISLYAPAVFLYDYKKIEYVNEVGETEVGMILLAYHGMGGSIVLPEEVDGLPVVALGEKFLAACNGAVSSVQIGSAVTSIPDTALHAPQEHPFGGVVRAEGNSFAAMWAAEMGYTVNDGAYTLSFETFGGSSIAPKQVSSGTYVRLPVPVLSGSTFLAWYLDEALSLPAELTDGCFVTPAGNVTLYACWEGEAIQWPFEFEETEDGIIITAYTGNETELTLPATINGLPVTAIDSYAFANAELSSITLPAGLQRIGRSAFAGSALERIDLGGTVSIEAAAFANCKALTNITLPASTSEVNPSAFDGCSGLEAFVVEEGSVFTTVDGVLIKNDTLWRYPQGRAAEAYTLPESVTRIGAGAFRNAVALTEVELHSGVEHMGEYAFGGCASLNSFIMPEGMWLAAIPTGAFSGCTALVEVELGSSVTRIGSYAFAQCGSLKVLEIPDTVKEIEKLALQGVPGDVLTIMGRNGSAAWNYAMEHGYTFMDPDVVQVTGLTIQCEPQVLLGGSFALAAQIMPENADLCGELSWTSSDEGLLMLTEGQAYALGTGTVTLQVIAPNGVYAEHTVEIIPAPMELSLTAMTMEAGQRLVIAVDLPQGGGMLGCTWTSDDESAVQVDGGVVTACEAGSALITCTTADGRKLTASIVVVDRMDTLRLPGALVTIEEEAFTAVPAAKIILDDGVESIGARAFANAELMQIQIPSSTASIADNAFENCSVVILCRAGSVAREFAMNHGIPYALLAE